MSQVIAGEEIESDQHTLSKVALLLKTVLSIGPLLMYHNHYINGIVICVTYGVLRPLHTMLQM